MHTFPVFIISGASKGIGAAVAHWLGAHGAALALLARSEDGLLRTAQAAEAAGGQALILPADVSKEGACAAAVRKTLTHFGRLDGLVNNAGTIDPLVMTVDAPSSAWRYNLEVNFFAALHLARAAMPHLKTYHGRIVNVSSGASERPVAGAGPYCVSKAALNQLTRVLALEEPDVTVVAVRPGVVDTDMQDRLRQRGPRVMPPAQSRYYLELKSRGRLLPPAFPARSIAWLVQYAPRNFSGRFMNYDDPQIIEPASEAFGATPAPTA